MSEPRNSIQKYAKVSESEITFKTPGAQQNVSEFQYKSRRPVSSNIRSQEGCEEEYELNKVTVGICLILLAVIIFLCVWFVFGGRIQSTKNDTWWKKSDKNTSIATELIDFSMLQNFSSFVEKKRFIESQLEDKLSKYNGSLDIFEPSGAKYWTVNRSELAKFTNLYTAFVQKYNQYIKISEAVKDYHKKLKEASSEYNSLEKQIRDEKARIIELLEKEQNLVYIKKLIDIDIDLLKKHLETVTFEHEAAKSKLQQENPEEKYSELVRFNCQALKKKMQDYLNQLRRLDLEAAETRKKLLNFGDDLDHILQRIEALQRELLEKEKLKNITELDYKTSKNIAELASEVEKLEIQKTNRIKDRIFEVLNTLKEKFELLKGYGKLSESDREKERQFFQSATKALKHNIQLLIKMKRLVIEEKRVAGEGLSSQKKYKDIKKDIELLNEEIKQLDRELKKLKEKFIHEEEQRKRDQESLIQKELELSEANKVVVETNSSLEDCLSKALIWQKEIENYEKRRNELLEPLETEMMQISGNLANKSDLTKHQKSELAATHRDISKIQDSVNSVIKSLAFNYQLIANEKHNYDNKRESLVKDYEELEFYKQKLIDFLTHVNPSQHPTTD